MNKKYFSCVWVFALTVWLLGSCVGAPLLVTVHSGDENLQYAMGRFASEQAARYDVKLLRVCNATYGSFWVDYGVVFVSKK